MKLPAYSGSGKYVFISYSHKDSEKIVYPIIETLAGRGYNIWYDEGIPLVADYGGVLYRKIRDCSVFVLFVSHNSAKSPDVEKEALHAISFGKPVLQIMIDSDADLPDSVAYHLPPTRNYLSMRTEPQEFYAKLEGIIAECREKKTAPARTDTKPDKAAPAKATPAPAKAEPATEKSVSAPPATQMPTPQKPVAGVKAAPQNTSNSTTASKVSPPAKLSDRKRSKISPKIWIACIAALVVIAAAVIAVPLIAGGGQPEFIEPEDTEQTGGTEQTDDSSQSDDANQTPETITESGFRFTKIDGGYELSKYIINNPNMQTDIIIPSEIFGIPITSIGDSAFYNCNYLTSITIPDSVTSIGDSAFEYCDSLTSITIPDSVTSIGDSAFEYCDSLTSITIPDSVTSIDDYAFGYCDSLTSITIPDSVTTIGDRAFFCCYNLAEISVDPDNSNFQSVDGILFNKTLSSLICYPCKKAGTTYVIPNSVTTIGHEAFYGCRSLTSVTIPDSVTTIGDYAFCDCYGLTYVTIPDSVTSISSTAFCYCNITVTAPHRASYYGYYGFDNAPGTENITWVVK